MGDRSAAQWRARGVRECAWPRRDVGGTARHVARQQRQRARLHGRRLGDGPRRPAATHRATRVGAQRPGHRQPTGAWLPGRAGPQAGADLSGLQHDHPRCTRQRLHRCPVRLQGHPLGRGAGAAPEVEDQAWFFDTELLVAAERHGYRIHEVPVDWVDDPDSRVDITSTAWRTCGHLAAPQALARLTPVGTGIARRLSLDSQLGQFAGIGILSTLGLLALVRGAQRPARATAPTRSPWSSAPRNTAAHRWITFANQGRLGVRAALAGIAAVLATSLVFTMAGLAIANLLAPVPSASEVVALAGRLRLCRPRALRAPASLGVPHAPARTAHERHHGRREPARLSTTIGAPAPAQQTDDHAGSPRSSPGGCGQGVRHGRCRRARPSGCSPLSLHLGALAQRRGQHLLRGGG